MTDLIIFGGQSNMQGQAECRLGDTPFEGVLEYRFLTDSLIPMKNPCGEDILFDGTEGFPFGMPGKENWHDHNALGSTVYGNTSLAPFFCEAYRKAAGNPDVVAVHAAKGATQMNYWLGDGYEMFIRKSAAAIAKTEAEKGEVGKKVVIWLQGESDAIAGVKKDDYKKMLSEFAHKLKAELGISRFCLIRVGIFTQDERDREIIDAQEELCAEDDFFLMLTRVCTDYCTKPEFKEYMNPDAYGHYSALGLAKLGELAGTALWAAER
jgi:hypothetical protein